MGFSANDKGVIDELIEFYERGENIDFSTSCYSRCFISKDLQAELYIWLKSMQKNIESENEHENK